MGKKSWSSYPPLNCLGGHNINHIALQRNELISRKRSYTSLLDSMAWFKRILNNCNSPDIASSPTLPPYVNVNVISRTALIRNRVSRRVCT